MINDPFASIGVVPIFVNAGAALVPTIIASLTSVGAVLLKPKELLALFRRRPLIPVAAIFIAAGLWFGIAHLLASPVQAATSNNKKTTSDRTSVSRIDWTALALQLIREKENAGKTTGVVPVWEYPADDGMVLSSPAFSPAANHVFGTAAVRDVASYYGILYCVDAATGKQIWKAEKADTEDLKAFFSSPALSADQKSIVIGQGLHADADCSLLCFNAESGELRWKVKTPLHIESSPAIRGDLAVVGAGAIEGEDHKPTTHPGYVLAVRISDGKELWRHDVADPESSPAIAEDGTVYIGSGFNGNAIVAMRSETDDELKSKNLQRQLWKTSAPYPITGPVTIVDDLVIVGGGNGDFVYEDPNPAGVVMALNRKDGSVKWQAKTDAAVLGAIVAKGGRLYCPVRNGQVIALNLADGQVIWRQSISGKAPVLGGVALSADGNTLFAVSKDGYLALVNTVDGQILERHTLNRKDKPGEKGLTLSTPTLAGDQLFLGSETGGLHCFKAVTAAK
jgi:outer membrane protein assembly factor BamB